jgi:hypothetical protein
MVQLKALEAAINQIETIHAHELTFTVDGQAITLRPLRSNEETDVQRYAQVAWEGMGEEGDTAAYQDFMDRVRLATLGFSIVRLGDMDLHGVDWVETGEIDENGNEISVPKWEAVRDLIRDQWAKAVSLQVFAKFGELLERVEIQASKLVKFDPTDLEEEIDRVEKRLADLKLKRNERKKNPTETPAQKAQKAVLRVDHQNQAARNRIRSNAGGNAAAGEASPERELPDEELQGVPQAVSQRLPQPAGQPGRPPQVAAREPSQSPPQPRHEPPQPQGRQSAIPQEAAPPDRYTLPDLSEEPPRQAPFEDSVDEQGFALPHEGDSFFDPSDPDAAMAAEAKRQAQLHAHHMRSQREKKMAQQRAEAMGMPSREDAARQVQQRQRDAGRPSAVSLDPRTSGLREAANLQDQVFDTGAGRQQTARPQRTQPQQAQPTHPQPAGRPGAPATTLHGKPVYKMPTQVLDRPARQRHAEAVERQHGDAPPGPVQINPAAGGRQDKFRAPGSQ